MFSYVHESPFDHVPDVVDDVTFVSDVVGVLDLVEDVFVDFVLGSVVDVGVVDVVLERPCYEESEVEPEDLQMVSSLLGCRRILVGHVLFLLYSLNTVRYLH